MLASDEISLFADGWARVGQRGCWGGKADEAIARTTADRSETSSIGGEVTARITTVS